MEDKFKVGDRVFHRNLKILGTFEGYDKLDTDTCYVNFDTDDGHDDERRVSLNQLELVSHIVYSRK